MLSQKRLQYQEHSMRQQNNPNLPCKYGPTCKYLITNNCRFYHPPHNQNIHQKRSNYYAQSNTFSQQPQRRSMSRGNKHNHYQQGNQFPKNEPAFTIPRSPSFGGKIQEDAQRSVCRFFHLGTTCQYGQKCSKKHQFLYNSSEKMRRIIHRRDIPQNAISKLCKIQCVENEVLSVRVGNEVFLISYEIQKNQLVGGSVIYELPVIQAKYEYYDQRQYYIYYSSQNSTTKFADLGFHHILSKETVWISNSHSSKITGMLHYDQDTLYSSSLEGDIKVWNKSQEGYLYNKQLSQQLVSFYNPDNKAIEILFLNLQVVESTKIMSAGTNDGRLLIWSSNNTEFMQINVQGYNKVYKAKTIKINGLIGSAVLAWNTINNSSAVLLFNLQNKESMIIRQSNAVNGKNFLNLHTFQFIDEYILVGNLKGEVSIYDVKEEVKQVGCILHQNIISDIIGSNVLIKSTGVCLKIVYILQKRRQEIEGSFSIYLIQ